MRQRSYLVHLDGGEWQDVHSLVAAQRRLDGQSHQLLPFDAAELSELSPLSHDILVGHVEGRLGCADEDCGVVYVEHSVLALGQQKHVRLSVHRLRPQSGSGQIHVRGRGGGGGGQLGQQADDGGRVRLQQLYFDERVVGHPDTLSLCTVVISTRLVVDWREDGQADMESQTAGTSQTAE